MNKMTEEDMMLNKNDDGFNIVDKDFTPKTKSKSITAITFLQDNTIIVGDNDGIIRIIDLSTGETIKHLNGHSSPISQLSRINDVGFISADINGNVFLWDEKNSSIQNRININQILGFARTAVLYAGSEPEKIYIKQIAVDQLHQLIFLLTDDKSMLPPYCWKYPTNNVLYVGGTEQYPCGCSAIAINQTAEYAIWTSGTAIYIYSIYDGNIIHFKGKPKAYGKRGTNEIYIPVKVLMNIMPFEGFHSDEITSVDFSPDNRYFITGSEDQSVRMWDFPGFMTLSNEKPVSIYELPYPINSVYFIGQNNWAAASYDDGVISIGDFSKNRIINQFEKKIGPIEGFSVSPSRKRFAACYKNGSVIVWFLQNL